MKQQKIIVLILLVLVIILVVFVVRKGTTPNTDIQNNVPTTATSTTPVNVSIAEVKKALLSATVTIPDEGTKAQLVNGEVDWQATDEVHGSIGLIPDVLAIHGTDVLAAFGVSSGGTGEFSYVFLFSYKNGKLTHTSSYFLGDRILVKKINTDTFEAKASEGEYIASISIVDRGENEPMAAEPTIAKTINIAVKNGVFNEQSVKITSPILEQ